jgi:hypothetical protein
MALREHIRKLREEIAEIRRQNEEVDARRLKKEQTASAPPTPQAEVQVTQPEIDDVQLRNDSRVVHKRTNGDVKQAQHRSAGLNFGST